MPYQFPARKPTQALLPFGQNNNNSVSSITGSHSEILELKVLKIKSDISKANKKHKELILELQKNLKELNSEIQWLREDVTDASGVSEKESDSLEDQESLDGSETDVDI